MKVKKMVVNSRDEMKVVLAQVKVRRTVRMRPGTKLIRGNK